MAEVACQSLCSFHWWSPAELLLHALFPITSNLVRGPSRFRLLFSFLPVCQASQAVGIPSLLSNPPTHRRGGPLIHCNPLSVAPRGHAEPNTSLPHILQTETGVCAALKRRQQSASRIAMRPNAGDGELSQFAPALSHLANSNPVTARRPFVLHGHARRPPSNSFTYTASVSETVATCCS